LFDSETTRVLVGSALPEGVSISFRGEQLLKGIDEAEAVYELEIEGVEITPARETTAPGARASRIPSRRAAAARLRTIQEL
jgi:hypothetical protein